VFAAIHGRVLAQPHAPLFVQRDWLRLAPMSPNSAIGWTATPPLRRGGVLHVLYPTTVDGLPIAGRHCPTVLVPTAHEEPMFELRIFDALYRAADAHVFLTPEERELVVRRFRFEPHGGVIGLGVDPPPEARTPSVPRADRPRGEAVHRLPRGIDPARSDELYRYFVEMRRRDIGDLALVVVGEAVTELPPHADVVVTGFVDEQTKCDALAGATALVQPSYFESFSIALCEAWAAGVPALVQGRCAVLAGQSAAGGGLPYRASPSSRRA
jgi:glycosyltransferase involved in cell wall biosynthesis